MEHFKEIVFGISIFTALSGVIATWVLMKKRISDLEKDMETSQNVHNDCSELQSRRYSELKDSIGDVKQHIVEVDGKVNVVSEKLDLLIQMNGKSRAK